MFEISLSERAPALAGISRWSQGRVWMSRGLVVEQALNCGIENARDCWGTPIYLSHAAWKKVRRVKLFLSRTTTIVRNTDWRLRLTARSFGSRIGLDSLPRRSQSTCLQSARKARHRNRRLLSKHLSPNNIRARNCASCKEECKENGLIRFWLCSLKQGPTRLSRRAEDW